MKLPNAHLATVHERKLTHYLLNPAHVAGGSKASFFSALWIYGNEMADALLNHARENEVVKADETPYGRRFVIDGMLNAPDGSRLNVRSAWYISAGESVPRFVTAHPLPKS